MVGDSFLEEVRQALLRWKQQQLQTSVKDDQDTQKLNLYLKETAIAHEMLTDYIQSKNRSVLDPSLDDVVNAIGDLSALSRDQRMLLNEYLFRDLIEYPFTYNTRLINSFQQKNALNTNIIPNK